MTWNNGFIASAVMLLLVYLFLQNLSLTCFSVAMAIPASSLCSVSNEYFKDLVLDTCNGGFFYFMVRS